MAPLRGAAALYLMNIVLSLGIMILGIFILLRPAAFGTQNWLGLVFVVYGIIRALIFYQRWRTSRPL